MGGRKRLKGVKLFYFLPWFLTRTQKRTRKPQLIFWVAVRTQCSRGDFSRVWDLWGVGNRLLCKTGSSGISDKESLKHLKKTPSLEQTIVINTGNWAIHSMRRRRRRRNNEELGVYQSQGQRSNNIYLCTARVGSCSCSLPNVLKVRSFPENTVRVIRPRGITLQISSVTQHLTRSCTFS